MRSWVRVFWGLKGTQKLWKFKTLSRKLTINRSLKVLFIFSRVSFASDLRGMEILCKKKTVCNKRNTERAFKRTSADRSFISPLGSLESRYDYRNSVGNKLLEITEKIHIFPTKKKGKFQPHIEVDTRFCQHQRWPVLEIFLSHIPLLFCS